MFTTASIGTETPTFRLEFLNLFALGARRCSTTTRRSPPPGGRRGARTCSWLVSTAWRRTSSSRSCAPGAASSPAVGEALRVTVAAEGADAFVAGLHEEHPELGELCDLTAGPEPADVAEPATVTYVCIADEAAALSAALALRAGAGREGPVVVAVADEESGVARALRAEGRALDGIAAFGVLGNALTPDLLRHADTEILARAKHDEYVRAEARRGPLGPRRTPRPGRGSGFPSPSRSPTAGSPTASAPSSPAPGAWCRPGTARRPGRPRLRVHRRRGRADGGAGARPLGRRPAPRRVAADGRAEGSRAPPAPAAGLVGGAVRGRPRPRPRPGARDTGDARSGRVPDRPQPRGGRDGHRRRQSRKRARRLG